MCIMCVWVGLGVLKMLGVLQACWSGSSIHPSDHPLVCLFPSPKGAQGYPARAKGQPATHEGKPAMPEGEPAKFEGKDWKNQYFMYRKTQNTEMANSAIFYLQNGIIQFRHCSQNILT